MAKKNKILKISDHIDFKYKCIKDGISIDFVSGKNLSSQAIELVISELTNNNATIISGFYKNKIKSTPAEDLLIDYVRLINNFRQGKSDSQNALNEIRSSIGSELKQLVESVIQINDEFPSIFGPDLGWLQKNYNKIQRITNKDSINPFEYIENYYDYIEEISFDFDSLSSKHIKINDNSKAIRLSVSGESKLLSLILSSCEELSNAYPEYSKNGIKYILVVFSIALIYSDAQFEKIEDISRFSDAFSGHIGINEVLSVDFVSEIYENNGLKYYLSNDYTDDIFLGVAKLNVNLGSSFKWLCAILALNNSLLDSEGINSIGLIDFVRELAVQLREEDITSKTDLSCVKYFYDFTYFINEADLDITSDDRFFDIYQSHGVISRKLFDENILTWQKRVQDREVLPFGCGVVGFLEDPTYFFELTRISALFDHKPRLDGLTIFKKNLQIIVSLKDSDFEHLIDPLLSIELFRALFADQNNSLIILKWFLHSEFPLKFANTLHTRSSFTLQTLNLYISESMVEKFRSFFESQICSLFNVSHLASPAKILNFPSELNGSNFPRYINEIHSHELRSWLLKKYNIKAANLVNRHGDTLSCLWIADFVSPFESFVKKVSSLLMEDFSLHKEIEKCIRIGISDFTLARDLTNHHFIKLIQGLCSVGSEKLTIKLKSIRIDYYKLNSKWIPIMQKLFKYRNMAAHHVGFKQADIDDFDVCFEENISSFYEEFGSFIVLS